MVSLSLSKQVSDELFTEMDWNCDGVITEEELITAFLRKVHFYCTEFSCDSHLILSLKR